MNLQGRHLLSIAELSLTDVHDLFAAATRLTTIPTETNLLPLKGKTVVNLFFEASTRTRMSFETATRRLGGSVANFTASQSSVQKGETLIDTARNIEALDAHALVLRHACAGTPGILAAKTRLPVINAGDGFHEHPTQALLDAYTIQKRLGSLKKKTVLIVGDIAPRASLAQHQLAKLGASVTVCGPPTHCRPIRKPESPSFAPDPVLEADATCVCGSNWNGKTAANRVSLGAPAFGA